MKLRKLISTGLTVGLILNNIPTSYAGILSEDGRQESFEGTSITIDNVLEEDKIDVEIEGNTMVNVANQKDPVPITKGYTAEGVNHIPLQGEYDGKARPVIEGNTMYYNNDTGELTDTFIEGANLSLVSSFEDQLVTQDMIDSGQEKPENLGKYKVEYKVTGKNKSGITGVTYYDNRNLINLANAIYGNKNLIVHNNLDKTLYSSVFVNGIWEREIYFPPNSTVQLDSLLADNEYILSFGQYYSQGWDNTYVFTEDDVWIEEGTTATEYEPYKESIKTFYLNSPLLEGDTIEDIDGKATHVKRYYQEIFDGSDDEDWNDYTGLEWTENIKLNVIGSYTELKNTPVLGMAMSNLLSHGDTYHGQANKIQVYNYPKIYITLERNKLETDNLAGIKQWLSNNPLTVVYKLASPIYETISEESILIDSYKDGHLDLSTNIPVNKVDFKPATTNLNYLYPSTEYTVQFESDNIGKIDKVSLGDETLYSDYSVLKGINRFNITTPSEITFTELILDGIGFNLSNLVITEATNESFDYFEGIQSVGQDDENGHNIEVISSNKNLFDINKVHTGGNYIVEGDTITRLSGRGFNQSIFTDTIGIDTLQDTSKLIKLNKGTYTFSYTSTTTGNEGVKVRFYDKHGNRITDNTLFNSTMSYFKLPVTLSLPFDMYTDIIIPQTVESSITGLQIEKGDAQTEYTPHQSNTLQIPLSEPLRSLPNGIKDRIIKRNGQWVVERNVGQLSGKNISNLTLNAINDNFIRVRIEDLGGIRKNDTISPVINNIFSFGGTYSGSTEIRDFENIEVAPTLGSDNDHRGICYLTISKEKANNLEEAKEWINNSNLEIVYELESPIYESLNIDLSLKTYLNTTHISNNSNIPANMKVTIDRTINIASEAIELAKTNPTTENLARARMWVNLLKESTLKDELQGEISGITDLEDMVLEKKSATANLDVYIKSENMLSMSLNTNSITFDNYSGVEDMELEDAIGISINSSLPYDLTASLESDIQNGNKSATMDTEILKIKDSSKNDYQSFISTTDKVILNEDCSAGNYISHNIDLKLESNNAYVPDVYKTTIKFEATQK